MFNKMSIQTPPQKYSCHTNHSTAKLSAATTEWKSKPSRRLRLPGRVAGELHRVAEVTARRSAEHDALLRVQVEGGAQLRQRRRRYQYHGREAEGARTAAVVEVVLVVRVTAIPPRAARREATDGAHLMYRARLCCFHRVASAKVRIVRRARARARSILTARGQFA